MLHTAHSDHEFATCTLHTWRWRATPPQRARLLETWTRCTRMATMWAKFFLVATTQALEAARDPSDMRFARHVLWEQTVAELQPVQTSPRQCRP